MLLTQSENVQKRVLLNEYSCMLALKSLTEKIVYLTGAAFMLRQGERVPEARHGDRTCLCFPGTKD